MGIIRSGIQLRLTGKEAEKYLNDTGRSALPKTVAEYNRAVQDAIDMWIGTDSPEGRLLAALLEDDLLAEERLAA